MTLQKSQVGLSSAHLHIIGMFLMLCDHAWAVSLLPYEFLTVIGRIAFPIFAFLMVEGFFHTRNVKKYLKRLLVFAIVSEIPFNLVVGASWFYPLHQNVLWTFWLGVLMLRWLENQRTKNFPKKVVMQFLIVTGFILLATITLTDYSAAGIMTIAVFYFFHGTSWYHYLGQLLGLYYINFEVLGGLVYPFSISNWSFEIPQQGFAILALIFIWLYNGQKGYNKTWFKITCYSFYPVHLLVLGLLSFVL